MTSIQFLKKWNEIDKMKFSGEVALACEFKMDKFFNYRNALKSSLLAIIGQVELTAMNKSELIQFDEIKKAVK